MDRAAASGRDAWVAVAAACLCFAGGFGLGRFAFALVNPVMTGAGWMTPAEAATAGARDLLGYIAGVILARRYAPRLPATVSAVGALTILAGAAVALAVPLGVWWVSAWRFLMGAVVAFIMVVAPTAALSGLPARQRTLAGGFIFSGVGFGILWGGLLIPQLAPDGPTLTMLGLAVAMGLTALAATALPSPKIAPPKADAPPVWTPALIGTACAYGCAAMVFIPHTVFWGDFVARALGQGVASGGFNFILMGLGAILGTIFSGVIAARIGIAITLRLYLMAAGAVLLVPFATVASPVMAAVAFFGGLANIGIPALASARVMEVAGPSGHPAAWGAMTLVYAIAYGLSGQGLAYVFALTDHHLTVFAIAASASVIGVLCDMAGAWRERSGGRHAP
jgi:hypothetical protein